MSKKTQLTLPKAVKYLKGWSRRRERLVARNIQLQKKLDKANAEIEELKSELDDLKDTA